jgi:hypothetical protein
VLKFESAGGRRGLPAAESRDRRPHALRYVSAAHGTSESVTGACQRHEDMGTDSRPDRYLVTTCSASGAATSRSSDAVK